tara:strand:- start:17 stop:169 length:153 start_codon:yes stop_codon:yes gene_type:complete
MKYWKPILIYALQDVVIGSVANVYLLGLEKIKPVLFVGKIYFNMMTLAHK